jgi:hypothetical protein
VRRTRALDPPAAHVSDQIVQRLLTAELRLGASAGSAPSMNALMTSAMSQTRGTGRDHGPVALDRAACDLRTGRSVAN